MAEDEARQAYLDRLDGILDTAFLQPFAAEMDAYVLGPFTALHLVATARRSTRTARRIAHDRYDSVGVQYVVAGRAQGEADGRSVVSEPGTVMILDYSRPFSVTDLEPRIVVNIALPRIALSRRIGELGGIHGTILAGPRVAILAGFIAELGRTLVDLPATAGMPLSRAFLDLLAVALDAEEAPDAAIDRNASLLRRAERLVDDRIGSADVGPTWLAGKLGLSRSDLYAVMEPFGGVSRFILYRRLHGARTALEDPADARRIGAIAYAYGFSSEASFARAFRAAFGVTASSARQTSRTQRQEK